MSDWTPPPPRAEKCLYDGGTLRLHFEKDDRWISTSGNKVKTPKQGGGNDFSVTKVTPPHLDNPASTDKFIDSGDYIKLQEAGNKSGKRWFAIRGFGIVFVKDEAAATTLFVRRAAIPWSEATPGCPDTAIRDGDHIIFRNTNRPNLWVEVDGDWLAVPAKPETLAEPARSEAAYYTMKIKVTREHPRNNTGIVRLIRIESMVFDIPGPRGGEESLHDSS